MLLYCIYVGRFSFHLERHSTASVCVSSVSTLVMLGIWRCSLLRAVNCLPARCLLILIRTLTWQLECHLSTVLGWKVESSKCLLSAVSIAVVIILVIVLVMHGECMQNNFWAITILLKHTACQCCYTVLKYGGARPVDMRSVDVSWNNAFRKIFNACWRDSIKPLQFYCSSLPASVLIHQRRIIFWLKMVHSDNVILHTLAGCSRDSVVALLD